MFTVDKDPKRLLVTVRNGKTGYRVANTMSGAVSAYLLISGSTVRASYHPPKIAHYQAFS